jgi:uncharacterized DUF497 family protein
MKLSSSGSGPMIGTSNNDPKPRIFFRETGHVEGEHLYEALSRTHAGRYLAIFFIRKPADKALIISARDMNPKERRRYGKK